MNRKLKISIVGVSIEGLLSLGSFVVLYGLLQLIFKGNVAFREILILTAAVTALFVVRLILYSVSYVGSQIGGSDVSRKIRIAMGDKMKQIPVHLFTKSKTGFYINGASSEVADYELILTHKVADIAKLIILIALCNLSALVIFLPEGIVLSISSLLILPTLYLIIGIVERNGIQKNRARQENVSNITEYISGMQTLRAYGMGGKKNETLRSAMKNYSDISYNYEKAVQPIGNIYMGISWLTLPISLYFTTNAYLQGRLEPVMMILMLMMPLFVTKVNSTLMIDLLSYKNLMLSKGNIKKIMEEETEEQLLTSYEPEKMDITLKGVGFSYDGKEQVLKNISFHIPEHSFTAIVGDSGSGKSTILNLISKYYLPNQGSIHIGNIDSKEATAEQVLGLISAVDQNVFLFNDTVRNNIRYAREDATDEEVEEACKMANCDEFIKQMPQGYDTEIGENGNRLSGGERQRLSVARALVKNSPIILLDEATASLDIENELLVKQAISKLIQTDKTVIMVAHTLPIVRQADQILVVQDGCIKEHGTHEELLKEKGKYAMMWEASRKMLYNVN
ncbi:MAG: ABC transporter ATP-binding protein [Anaerostipes sp.]|nr:ABC transporter ATP-binding protein [Anaerostipes sp.]